MLAAWVGAMVIMLLADWLLPHVYNIGFQGFQASLLVWMFLGGLVAVEQMTERESLADEPLDRYRQLEHAEDAGELPALGIRGGGQPGD
jgi:hypothetical protein